MPVATDGHRLARIETALPKGAASIPGVIVPRKVVTEMYRLIEGKDDEISISLSDSKIRAEFDGAVLTSKLIDGTFPDYQRVIPSGNDKLMTVEKADFAAAVDRVSTISSERGRAVKLMASDGKLTALAVSTPQRSPILPQVPTTVEAGVPGSDYIFWVGMIAPSATPPAVIKRLNEGREARPRVLRRRYRERLAAELLGLRKVAALRVGNREVRHGREVLWVFL